MKGLVTFSLKGLVTQKGSEVCHRLHMLISNHNHIEEPGAPAASLPWKSQSVHYISQLSSNFITRWSWRCKIIFSFLLLYGMNILIFPVAFKAFLSVVHSTNILIRIFSLFRKTFSDQIKSLNLYMLITTTNSKHISFSQASFYIVILS